MNMKLYFWLPAFILFLSGCRNNKPDNHGSDLSIPIDTISWSNFSLEDTEVFPAENVVEYKKYIKLDASETYLFGGADKILYKDQIYLLDKRQKKVIIFDEAGNGINVLSKVGQGPEEYVQITDFSVDVESNIYMIDGVSDKLMIYSNTGEFISSKKLPFEVDIIQCLDNGDLLMGLSTWNKHSETKGRRLLIVDRNLIIKSTMLEFDTYHDDSYWISYYSFISNGSNIYYNKPIEDFIYTLSGDGDLVKAYYVDFGVNQIPFEWRKDVERHMVKIEERYRCLKNYTLITDKYIIGTLWDKTVTKPFLVDRIENKVYLHKGVVDSDISDVCDFRDNTIVSLIYPGKQDDLQKTNLPLDMQEHISNGNYVLCLTKLL